MDGTDGSADDVGNASEPAGTFRGLVSSVLDTLKTRLDLVAVEAEIYLLRTMQSLLWAIAALACALVTFVFIVVAIIAALWDSHRMAGVLGGAGVFALLAIVSALLAARTFRVRPMVLDQTLKQLEHDRNRVSGAE